MASPYQSHFCATQFILHVSMRTNCAPKHNTIPILHYVITILTAVFQIEEVKVVQ